MYRLPAISHHSRKSPLRSISAKRGGAFGAAQILAMSPAAWFRWNVGITVATGVSQWSDQSGNGNHLAQATGGSQPAKNADGSILFNGTTHVMRTGAFTNNQPTTIYLLAKQVTWTASRSIFDGLAANALRFTQTAGVSPEVQIRAGVSGACNNSGWTLNTYAALCTLFNGASSLVQVNNTTPTTGDAGTGSPGGFNLGSDGTGTGGFANVEIKEVIMFSAAHTALQRRQVIGYLARLGGISV